MMSLELKSDVTNMKELLTFPTLSLIGEITDTDARIVSQFTQEILSSEQNNVLIKIASEGGDILAAYVIIDALSDLKEAGINVHILASQRIYSAAMIILLHSIANKSGVYARKDTKFMMHPFVIPLSITGRHAIVEGINVLRRTLAHLEEIQKQEKKFLQLYQKISQFPLEQLKQEVSIGKIFDAEEALKRNLIAHIIT